MAKDPAFLFYPNDYIGGTMGMTFEEKGAYIELLMMQFNRGHMTTLMVGQTVGQLWDKIQDKFIQDKDGLWFNERLDEEKDKRKKFTESRYNNLSGKNQYSKSSKKKRGHKTSHKEDVNENVNRIEVREEIFRSDIQNFKHHPASMLLEFFEYWSEPNKQGKMRFELEKTWDLKRRLSRWAANSQLKAPVSKKQPVEERTGHTMTQKQIIEYHKEHGEYPK